MISSRPLFRINVLASRGTNACAKSQPAQYLQKCYLSHDLSYELRMDVNKGMLKDTERGKHKPDKQTWRAVSTQSSSFERDGEKGGLQSRLGNIYHAASTNLTAKCETANPEDVNGPVHLDTCVSLEDVNEDRSLDGKFMALEKHSMSMNVGQSLMRFIVGKGRGTQKEIEVGTGVKIILPSSRKEESIIIEGNSVESVTKASEKVQIIIDKAVNSRALDYSHFVSLPLAIHPGLVDKLINFQNTILQIMACDNGENLDSDTSGDNEDMATRVQEPMKAPKNDMVNAEKDDAYVDVNVKTDQHSTKASVVTAELKDKDADSPAKVNISNIPLASYYPKKSKTPITKPSTSNARDLGIEKSIFINPKTFHLTVLMLKLWNKERVNAAAEVLRSVSSRVMDALDNRPVSIKLRGLECMKGSLAKARVIYAPVEEVGGEDRLMRACQVIIDAFAEGGLLTGTDAQQKLKLHATLMNARHRERNKNTWNLESFDARGIFHRYGSEEWGEYPICEAHLSQRSVYDENGYYHCCASIPFPDNMQAE
ncbi:activating signal cointegrator 1 complex subunit 1-like [Dorcoceras hygrometricum]|uniref:Activating signal cointegrator 1 complex subunit 1-like n=1 Tax=Dorcoceras hygrometricum TaxID=472368 RepID=A0A2Z7DBB8_9LAMI|nr:activating signal cointegrator 1 complex subunit 1-like [Dorcoceras hygrometricum]